MIIRPEREGDYPEIYNLIRTAFETAKVADGTEQDFANGLRAGGGYLPGLALVAQEADGALIGHIMLTRLALDTPKGPADGLLLAPLSVLLPHRGRGVGGALVREALARGAEAGYPAVFLMGDPAYYGRFGFCRADDHDIYNKNDLPPEHLPFFLACPLREGALEELRGSRAAVV